MRLPYFFILYGRSCGLKKRIHMNISSSVQQNFIKLFAYDNRSVGISHDKKITGKRVSLEKIFYFQYILINPKYYNWIHIDVDFTAKDSSANTAKYLDPFYYDSIFLPRPNIAVFNTKGVHLFWHLKIMISPDKTKKAFTYYTDIRNRIITTLNGDSSCRAQNLVVKNPFWTKFDDREKDGEAFFFTTNNYELDNFKTFLRETPDPTRSLRKRSYNSQGFKLGNRNNDMFNYLLECYNNDPSITKSILENRGQQYQAAFPDVEPLEKSELNEIIESVMSGEYSSQVTRDYGKMQLPKIKGGTGKERKKKISEHQRLGALSTANDKSNKTIEKIEHAIATLKKEKQKISAKAIALEIKMSDRTVREYITVKRGVISWKKQKSGS